MVRSVTGYKELESTLKRLQLAGGNSRDLRTALVIGHKITNLQDHIAILLPVSCQDDVSTAHYTYQVASTLPGGIQILGLAVSLAPAQIKSQLPRLKGLVSSVWKSSCCGVKEWVELGGCGYQMIVYFSTDSRKIRCLSLDVTDPHSTFDFPGLEVKTISNPNLVAVNSSLSFDINHITTTQVNADISKTLRHTIKQCIDTISRGVATFKNQLPSDDDPVSTLLHKSDISLIVDFFWRLVNVEETNPHEIKEGNQIKVKDGLYCKAYVHEKTSWDDTVKALKLDGIKSLMIRQSLLLNELVDDNKPNEDSLNKTTQHIKLMLPRRVWCVAGTQGFSLTDYCFPNEGEAEVRENLRSIWGDALDVVLEEDHEVIKTQEDEERSIQDNKNHKIVTGSNTTVYYLIAAVIVLIMAIILVIFTV